MVEIAQHVVKRPILQTQHDYMFDLHSVSLDTNGHAGSFTGFRLPRPNHPALPSSPSSSAATQPQIA
jgi:hypothetical protein